jgi:hypothetical protein
MIGLLSNYNVIKSTKLILYIFFKYIMIRTKNFVNLLIIENDESSSSSSTNENIQETIPFDFTTK